MQIDSLRSSFVKNVITVMSGAALAQGIGFLLSPLISRLYSPSDFGVFGSFTSVLSIVAAGVTLQYSQAIMLPKEKRDALQLLVVSCLATTVIAIACAVCSVLLYSTVSGWLQTEGVWALVMLNVGIAVSGYNESLQAWNVRVKAFKHASASQLIRSISSNAGQIALGYAKTGSTGLIVSNVLAECAASVNLAKVAFRDYRQSGARILSRDTARLAREYRDFPAYSASMNVINAASRGLPVLALTYYYGIAVAGSYAFGIRLLSVPMNLVSNALRQVLFQKAAEIYNEGGRLVPLFTKVTGGLFAAAFAPAAALVVWAPAFFAWLFGSQWLQAGEYARYLVMWLVFMFCNVPAILLARILRIQRMMFAYDIVLFASRLLALVYGGMFLAASATVLLYSAVGAVMNVVYIAIVGFVLARRERSVQSRTGDGFAQ